MDRLDRFELLRETMKQGPALSLHVWAAQAGFSAELLMPSRRRWLSQEKIASLADAAERLIGVTPRRIAIWLAGTPDEALEIQLHSLLAKAACSKCTAHFDKESEDFFPEAGLCRGCHNQRVRERASPHTANYAEYLLRYEADLRRVNPLLADAVVVAAANSSRAVTYAYLAELSGLASDEVRQILADLDMLKPRKSRGSWDRSRPASGGG